MDQFWEDCKQYLRNDVSKTEDEYQRCVPYLKLGALDKEQNVLLIYASGSMRLSLAQTSYLEPIQSFARDRLDIPTLTVRIESDVVSEQNNQTSDVAQQPQSKNKEADTPPQELVNSIQEGLISYKKALERAQLIPEFTLSNFVMGDANRFAVSAAREVISSPGCRDQNNPFFIYGKTGLGKTHLMHAIGCELITSGRVRKVRAVEAQVFCDEYIKASKTQTIDTFKKSYYDLDMLLVDDVQFFSKKEKTEEVFLYLFDHLVRSGKQVVLTSDTSPNKLEKIKANLLSRFLSGLVVEVKPPQLDMRIEILQKKAEQKLTPQDNIVLPYESARFIAKHLKTNVRELEGALNKVIALARFEKVSELTVEFCKRALEDLLFSSRTVLSIEDIQKETAQLFGVEFKELISRSRTKNLILPRHVAMLMSKQFTSLSMVDIGKAFNRDHTTVLSGVRNVEKKRKTDDELERKINILEHRLKG